MVVSSATEQDLGDISLCGYEADGRILTRHPLEVSQSTEVLGNTYSISISFIIFSLEIGSSYNSFNDSRSLII